MDGRGNVYTPPGASNHGRTRSSSSRAPSGDRGEANRNANRSRGPSQPDNLAPLTPSDNTRALGNSASLAPSTRLKHYASLLLAEKPVEAHREFQRKVRTGGATRPLDDDGGDMMDTMNAGHRPEPAGGRHSARNGRDAAAGGGTAPSPFVHDELGGNRNNDRGGRNGAPSRPREAGQAGGADEDDLDADAADPEYEAYRKAFKQGFMYRILKGEIVKNKRRRGRAGYLSTLKSVYRCHPSFFSCFTPAACRPVAFLSVHVS